MKITNPNVKKILLIISVGFGAYYIAKHTFFYGVRFSEEEVWLKFFINFFGLLVFSAMLIFAALKLEDSSKKGEDDYFLLEWFAKNPAFTKYCSWVAVLILCLGCGIIAYEIQNPSFKHWLAYVGAFLILIVDLLLSEWLAFLRFKKKYSSKNNKSKGWTQTGEKNNKTKRY